MCSTAPKTGLADQAKTKAQLLAELNELRQRVAHLEATGNPLPDRPDWYRLIFETTPQGIVQVDPRGQILAANPGLAGMLGYPVADLLGRSLFDFVDETDRPRLQASFKGHQQGQAHQGEVQLRRQDGSDLWGLVSVTPVLAETGELLFSVGLLTDITEHKRTEAALRASEARFATIFRASPLSISLVRLKDSQIIDVNEMWQSRAGYSREEALGRTPLELNLWSNPADRERLIRQLREHGTVHAFEVQIRLKSNLVEDVLMSAEVVEVAGEPCLLTLSQGISDRKRMEAALRQSEEKFAKVFHFSPVLIAICELGTGRYLEVNDLFLRTTGYRSDEVIGRCPAELGLFARPEQPLAAQQLFEEQGYLRDFEAVIRTKSGELRDGLFGAEYIEVQGRRMLLTVMSDITERKQAEAALRASEARFATVFRANPLSIIITRLKDGQIIDVNPTWETRSGFSRAEAIGRTSSELNLWFNLDDRTRLLKQLHEQGPVRGFEGQIRLRSGRVVEALISAELIEIGGEACLLALIQDISERKQMEQALRTSEQRLRQIIEYSADGVALADPSGRLIEWNPTMEQISGLTREAVVGRPIGEVQFGLLPAERRTPARLKQVQAGVEAYLQTGQNPRADRGTIEIQRPDGSYRDIQAFDFAIKSEAGFLIGSIVRDVTERKQAERLEAAQLAVSRILAASPEPAVALSQILAAIAVRLGWDLAKLWWPSGDGSRLVWQDGWHDPDQSELIEFEQTGQSDTFEPGEGLAGTVWLTGRASWGQSLRLPKLAAAALAVGLHSATAIPVIKDGITVGVMTFFSRSARPLDERLLATLTDLGRQIGHFLARKQTEETLRRYEQMVSTTPDWMSLVDHDYVYQIVNSAYLSFHNKAYNQIIGHTVAELTGETVFETLVKPHLDRALAGEMVQYQAWFDFPGAGRRFNDVTYTPYRHQDGTVSGVIVSGRDITAAKLLEERLHQTRKMETVGQLAAGVAHHYNNMLTPIIGYTSLSLQTLPPDTPLARNLKLVLQTAERMAVLVRQLLAFARKQLLLPKPVTLNELVLQLQPGLQRLVPPPVQFSTQLTPEAGQVQVDPGQFEQLLRALVSNAGEAMPAGGRLTLTTAQVSLGPDEAEGYDLPPGDYVLLSIQDTGLGLTEQVRAHLFEPFFTTKQVGQGLGLGLAMALGIAKQHGGHLLAESQPGQGATFTLYLPRLTSPPA